MLNSPLVRLLSFLYRMGAILRFKPPSIKVDAVVVSIGNIAIGGTGKTPTLIFLAKELLAKEIPIAVLSRGYLSQQEHKQPIRVAPHHSWKEVGDEPYLIYRRLKCPVYVGKNRVVSATMAVAAGAKVLLLDDGFQYQRLYRDIDIVTLCADRPYAYFRERLGALKRADLVVVKSEGRGGRKEVGDVWMRVKVARAEDLRGVKVGAFCGIGNPKSFFRTLQELGTVVVDSYVVRDHKEFPQLARFAKRCLEKGASYLVCTEKDGVRISSEDLFIRRLSMDFEIEYGKEKWEKLIENIIDIVQNGYRCLKRSKSPFPN